MFHEQARRIVLSGTIEEGMAAYAADQITLFERLDPQEPISIYLDTVGGSIYSALLIHDIIKISACPIEIIGCGKVFSAGILILAAGDKGMRYVTQNTRCMIHQVSSGFSGSLSEINTTMNEIKYLQNKYADLLVKYTKMSKKQILEEMRDDTFFDAEKAIDLGICDYIVAPRKTILKKEEKVKKVSKKTPKNSVKSKKGKK